MIAKISILCWGGVCSFVLFLTVLGIVPENAVWPVSALVGGIILGLLGFDFYRFYQKERFDFASFLVFRKGLWRLFLGLAGLGLFGVGIIGLLVPQLAQNFAEKHAMTIAKLLVILFWTALTFTFLGWELICFSESTVYFLQKKLKSAVGSFALGILWLLFALLFLYLFLEVINDVFVNLNPTTQNWILGIFAILSVITGLWNGRFESLKDFEEL